MNWAAAVVVAVMNVAEVIVARLEDAAKIVDEVDILLDIAVVVWDIEAVVVDIACVEEVGAASVVVLLRRVVDDRLWLVFDVGATAPGKV